MTKSANPKFGNTVNKTKRGAGPDGRARMKKKKTGQPGTPPSGPSAARRGEANLLEAPEKFVETNPPSADIDHARTFAELSDCVEIPRSTLADIKRRDKRFPAKGPKGWSVLAVRFLLTVREWEAKSDAEWDQFVRDCDLTPKPGAREAGIAYLLECMEQVMRL